jgi:hypothetical protein
LRSALSPIFARCQQVTAQAREQVGAAAGLAPAPAELTPTHARLAREITPTAPAEIGTTARKAIETTARIAKIDIVGCFSATDEHSTTKIAAATKCQAGASSSVIIVCAFVGTWPVVSKARMTTSSAAIIKTAAETRLGFDFHVAPLQLETQMNIDLAKIKHFRPCGFHFSDRLDRTAAGFKKAMAHLRRNRPLTIFLWRGKL